MQILPGENKANILKELTLLRKGIQTSSAEQNKKLDLLKKDQIENQKRIEETIIDRSTLLTVINREQRNALEWKICQARVRFHFDMKFLLQWDHDRIQQARWHGYPLWWRGWEPRVHIQAVLESPLELKYF